MHITIGTLEVVHITEIAVAVVRHITNYRTVTASCIIPAALDTTIVPIADETHRAVVVNFTTTQVRVSIVTTNGEKLGAVGVLDTAWGENGVKICLPGLHSMPSHQKQLSWAGMWHTSSQPSHLSSVW